MLYVERLFEGHAHPELTLTLTHERRQKLRQRAVLDNGLEVALCFARGTLLRPGDVLVAADGTLILVQAAEEELSVVVAEDALTLARAAYHLGNRHVALQIRPRELTYLRDHVLDQMVEQLGLRVVWHKGPFEPEMGAYSNAQAHASSHAEGTVTGEYPPAHAGGEGHEHARPPFTPLRVPPLRVPPHREHTAVHRDASSSPEDQLPRGDSALTDPDAEELTEPNFRAPFAPVHD